MMKLGQLSEGTACKLTDISRTAYRYLLLHGILKAEGLVVNKKHTYRLCTEEGLQVRTKKRKKLQRPRQPMEVQYPQK